MPDARKQKHKLTKDEFLIFEEKVPISELTDRERQAYERGIEDGFSETCKSHWLYLVGILIMAVLFGVYLSSVVPEIIKQYFNSK